MRIKITDKEGVVTAIKPTNQIIIDLQYLTAEQATSLIKMFDSPKDYAENFSAIKAITRGLFNIILETRPEKGSPIGRLFDTVNDMQDAIMLDDMQENERILRQSGLMPNTWSGFGKREEAGHA